MGIYFAELRLFELFPVFDLDIKKVTAYVSLSTKISAYMLNTLSMCYNIYMLYIIYVTCG